MTNWITGFYDTSTLPTQDMLDAITRAPLGDGVYGLDPTVNELEAVAAGLMGKDAAVLMPSGTMANLAAALRAEEVERHLREPDLHYPLTRLLYVENTHNRAGGTITPPAVMKELRELCEAHQLALHVDGAQIFNAAVALDIPAAELVADADSVFFALSKGLSAGLVVSPAETNFVMIDTAGWGIGDGEVAAELEAGIWLDAQQNDT